MLDEEKDRFAHALGFLRSTELSEIEMQLQTDPLLRICHDSLKDTTEFLRLMTHSVRPSPQLFCRILDSIEKIASKGD